MNSMILLSALIAVPLHAQEVDHSKMDHSQMDHSQMDHSKMDHATMDHSAMPAQPMDAEGRRKSAMAHSTGHKMGGAVYEEMRTNIPTYRSMTDNEMDLAMGMMGDDMEWYVSDKSLTGDVGVLLLAHGTGGGADHRARRFVRTHRLCGGAPGPGGHVELCR